MFGCVAYAMVHNEKSGELNVQVTKCLFLGYCEESKTYGLTYLELKKTIKNKDVIFMEDSSSI